jgi:hypothetical protein
VYIAELVKWFSAGWMNEASFLAVMGFFFTTMSRPALDPTYPVGIGDCFPGVKAVM